MPYSINETMEDELVEIIKEITGAESVYWVYQNAFVEDTAGVKPSEKDFITLKIIAGPTPISGVESTASGNNPGNFNLSAGFNFTVSVNLYTNNAHLFKIAKISMLMRSEKYQIKMKAVGLGFMDDTDPQDLSEFDETRFNLRSHIDLLFSYIETENNVNEGQIDSFEATGDLGDNAVEIKVNKNVSP